MDGWETSSKRAYVDCYWLYRTFMYLSPHLPFAGANDRMPSRPCPSEIPPAPKFGMWRVKRVRVTSG